MTDLENDLLTRLIDVMPIRVNFQSQDNFNVNIVNYRERLDAPFAISPGITLPLGAVYDFTRYRIFFSTAHRRMLALNGRFETGGFYSGTRTERQFNLSLRLRPGLFLFLNGQWNDIKLAEGRFKTTLYRFIGETQFSPFIVARQQHSVRFAERRARLAVAVPLDRDARQRPLRGLHAQLAGRPAAQPLRDARQARSPRKSSTPTGSRSRTVKRPRTRYQ